MTMNVTIRSRRSRSPGAWSHSPWTLHRSSRTVSKIAVLALLCCLQTHIWTRIVYVPRVKRRLYLELRCGRLELSVCMLQLNLRAGRDVFVRIQYAHHRTDLPDSCAIVALSCAPAILFSYCLPSCSFPVHRYQCNNSCKIFSNKLLETVDVLAAALSLPSQHWLPCEFFSSVTAALTANAPATENNTSWVKGSLKPLHSIRMLI